MKKFLIAGFLALAVAIPAVAQNSGKTRAEVQADLAMWQRAGLGNFYNSEVADPLDPQAQSKVAEYERLRNGPEYKAALLANQ